MPERVARVAALEVQLRAPKMEPLVRVHFFSFFLFFLRVVLGAFSLFSLPRARIFFFAEGEGLPQQKKRKKKKQKERKEEKNEDLKPQKDGGA